MAIPEEWEESLLVGRNEADTERGRGERFRVRILVASEAVSQPPRGSLTSLTFQFT